MTKYDIYSAVGEVFDKFIEESAPTNRAETKKKSKSGRLALRTGALAACLCIILCGMYSLVRLGYFSANCGSSPGVVVDGVYYYSALHRGICAYTPDSGAELLVSDLFRDDRGFEVDSYGVYYTWGHTLYVRVHETGKTEPLYRADPGSWTHITCSRLSDNGIVLRLFNKRLSLTEALLLDGKTGEVKKIVSEKSEYANYTETVDYNVGQRVITCTYQSNPDPVYFIFAENGVPLFDGGVMASPGSPTGCSTYAGESLIIDCYRTDSDETLHYSTLIRPDGTAEEIFGSDTLMGGTDRFLLTVRSLSDTAQELRVLDIDTGESRALIGDYTDYEAVTDGVYLYTTAPWSQTTRCYRLIYDEAGMPSDAEPVSDDIGK